MKEDIDWTDEMVAELTRLRADPDMSTVNIATTMSAKFRCNITVHMVNGKCARLIKNGHAIAPRPSPIRKAAEAKPPLDAAGKRGSHEVPRWSLPPLPSLEGCWPPPS